MSKIMKKSLPKAVAAIGKKSAESGCNSASIFGYHLIENEKIPNPDQYIPKQKGTTQKQQAKPSPVRDKITTWIYADLIGIAVLVSFFIIAGTYKERFLPNTMINSVDVSSMTAEEAAYTILSQLGDLRLTDHNGKETVFSAADFDASYSISLDEFDEPSKESKYSWFGKLFHTTEYTARYDCRYDSDKLRELINTHDWGDAVTQNAHIVRSESGDFVIQPETLGDQFDTNILMTYLDEQLQNGRLTLNMEDSGCYEPYLATIRAENLQSELELYNSYAKCSITFDFEDRTKKVDSDMIVDWFVTLPDGSVMKDAEGNPQFDREKVAVFVQQMAAETDTLGTSRSFYATVDGWITLPWSGDLSSTYGWQINQAETVEQLIGLMRSAVTVTVEPKYKERGYCRATDDIGSTYVEVDISEQHLWLYKNNEIVLESDIVSGTETDPERRTPRGICKIWSHEVQRVLGTMEVQGYETPVNYWMPFNYLGCGFHDLGRSAYGGSIYMYNGSHGCINMPLSKARELYDMTENGVPVIIHD